MHDTLDYLRNDPVHRKFHHNRLTFRMLYAFHENFVLALSHDEVVHGKRSLLDRMAGDTWQKFANLRLLFGYQFAQSGKKLLFMGGEFGQRREWNHDTSLDWHLTNQREHAGIQRWVADLNKLYRREPALHANEFQQSGFEWVDVGDVEQSIIGFLRRGKTPEDVVLVVANFTPIPRHGYRVGVPHGGHWRELVNSNAETYGGTGMGNLGGVEAEATQVHGRAYSLNLTLPPLAILFLGKR